MEDWTKYVDSYGPDGIEIGNIWTRDGVLQKIAHDLACLIGTTDFDAVATAETKGIIYAAPVAADMGKPLLVFRKRNRIIHTDKKYTDGFVNWKQEEDGLEIEMEALALPRNIIFIDDMVHRLSTIQSVHRICGRTGCRIVKHVCFANISGQTGYHGAGILSLIHT